MVHLTIDDKPIEIAKGRTLLEACREHGIHVPTLCYHPALEPYGSCRLCIVEVRQGEGPSRLVASCAYPCEEGLVVWTNSEVVQKNRRITVELLLASAFDTPEIAALAEELNVQEIRYKMPQADSCIICGLCVRACSEIVGVGAISMIHRGINKKVSAPFEVSSTTCIGCGTCVLICPTGALRLNDVCGYPNQHQFASEHDHVHCALCGLSRLGSQVTQVETALLIDETIPETSHE
ncbi:2Fe-2S iron-sulfur cluster-binding protein [Chloroflexota bacterium]